MHSKSVQQEGVEDKLSDQIIYPQMLATEDEVINLNKQLNMVNNYGIKTNIKMP